MKTIRIDDNAHELLIQTKEKMKQQGIEKPSFSDVIRWLYSQANKEG